MKILYLINNIATVFDISPIKPITMAQSCDNETQYNGLHFKTTSDTGESEYDIAVRDYNVAESNYTHALSKRGVVINEFHALYGVRDSHGHRIRPSKNEIARMTHTREDVFAECVNTLIKRDNAMHLIAVIERINAKHDKAIAECDEASTDDASTKHNTTTAEHDDSPCLTKIMQCNGANMGTVIADNVDASNDANTDANTDADTDTTDGCVAADTPTDSECQSVLTHDKQRIAFAKHIIAIAESTPIGQKWRMPIAKAIMESAQNGFNTTIIDKKDLLFDGVDKLPSGTITPWFADINETRDEEIKMSIYAMSSHSDKEVEFVMKMD